MKTKYGSAGKAVPGYDVQIMKPDQTLAKPNEMGDIVVKLPLPPGTFPTLWNADSNEIDIQKIWGWGSYKFNASPQKNLQALCQNTGLRNSTT